MPKLTHYVRRSTITRTDIESGKILTLAYGSVGLALLLWGGSTAAYAQSDNSGAIADSADQEQTGNTPSTGGDIIIVTARRKEERLQDVPISISVFNQEQLKSANITRLENLSSFTPSLSVSPTTSRANVPGFTIRA